MIDPLIRKKLNLFRDNTVEIIENGNTVYLIENNDEGYAHLKCTVRSDALVFHAPEQNVSRYFKCDCCADKIVFKCNVERRSWELHVFEFKRKVSLDKWKKARKQWKMATLNALMLAGIFDLKFDEMKFYICYRQEDLLAYSANIIELKTARIKDSFTQRLLREWKKECCVIDFEYEEKEVKFSKIILDEQTGMGEMTL